MRLFAAIDLDAAAQAGLAAEPSRMRAAADAHSPLRWVRPDPLHMTLVFLGEVGAALADDAMRAVNRPLPQAPFDLEFAGAGAFPPRGAPRALWIGVRRGEPELRMLQTAVAERIAALGVTLEPRPFAPHLTVGRWKFSRSSDRRLADALPPSTIATVRIDHVTLYRSQVSSSGSTYTPLARANLAAD
jgi:2'-5' RNA ligase